MFRIDEKRREPEEAKRTQILEAKLRHQGEDIVELILVDAAQAVLPVDPSLRHRLFWQREFRPDERLAHVLLFYHVSQLEQRLDGLRYANQDGRLEERLFDLRDREPARVQRCVV